MGNSKLKIIIASLVGLCIIAALVYVLVNIKPQAPANQTEQPQKTEPEAVRTNVSPEILPDTIPADIPYEKNAKVTQNYTQVKGDENQSTRIYESDKSLAASYKIFSDYFKANGWTIMNSIDLPESKMIYGKKGDVTMQVTMSYNKTLNTNFVDVTVTY